MSRERPAAERRAEEAHRAAVLDELADLLGTAGAPGPWVADAVCASTDPEAFHPVGRRTSPRYRAGLAAARAVCAGCPVRAECLSYAVGADVLGVWGGTDEHERRELTRHLRPVREPETETTTPATAPAATREEAA